MAANPDLARDVVVKPGDEIEECGLSRTIDPQQGSKTAYRNFNRNIVQCAARTECVTYSVDRQR